MKLIELHEQKTQVNLHVFINAWASSNIHKRLVTWLTLGEKLGARRT